MQLPDYVYRVSFGKTCRPLKLPLSCEIVEKGGCGASIFSGRVYPTFRTCIFKAH